MVFRPQFSLTNKQLWGFKMWKQELIQLRRNLSTNFLTALISSATCLKKGTICTVRRVVRMVWWRGKKEPSHQKENKTKTHQQQHTGYRIQEWTQSTSKILMLNARTQKHAHAHTHTPKSNRIFFSKKRGKKIITSITAVYNHFNTTKPIYRGTSI